MTALHTLARQMRQSRGFGELPCRNGRRHEGDRRSSGIECRRAGRSFLMSRSCRWGPRRLAGVNNCLGGSYRPRQRLVRWLLFLVLFGGAPFHLCQIPFVDCHPNLRVVHLVPTLHAPVHFLLWRRVIPVPDRVIERGDGR